MSCGLLILASAFARRCSNYLESIRRKKIISHTMHFSSEWFMLRSGEGSTRRNLEIDAVQNIYLLKIMCRGCRTVVGDSWRYRSHLHSCFISATVFSLLSPGFTHCWSQSAVARREEFLFLLLSQALL